MRMKNRFVNRLNLASTGPCEMVGNLNFEIQTLNILRQKIFQELNLIKQIASMAKLKTGW